MNSNGVRNFGLAGLQAGLPDFERSEGMSAPARKADSVVAPFTTLDFVTISGNQAHQHGGGGGIFTGEQAGRFTLHDTIVVANDNGNCIAGTALTSSGYNLEDTTICGFGAVGDQSAVNPRLGSLADNGGPTSTMALGVDSPAVDAADPACDQAADQRGVKRPQGARCDVGAFELEASTAAPAAPRAPVTGRRAVEGGGTAPVMALLIALGGLGAVGLGIVMRHGPSA